MRRISLPVFSSLLRYYYRHQLKLIMIFDKLNDEAESLLNKNPKQSLELATKARAQAETANYRKGKARAVALQGVANYKVDEYPRAKELIT